MHKDTLYLFLSSLSLSVFFHPLSHKILQTHNLSSAVFVTLWFSSFYPNTNNSKHTHTHIYKHTHIYTHTLCFYLSSLFVCLTFSLYLSLSQNSKHPSSSIITVRFIEKKVILKPSNALINHNRIRNGIKQKYISPYNDA